MFGLDQASQFVVGIEHELAFAVHGGDAAAFGIIGKRLFRAIRVADAFEIAWRIIIIFGAITTFINIRRLLADDVVLDLRLLDDLKKNLLDRIIRMLLRAFYPVNPVHPVKKLFNQRPGSGGP